MSALEVSLDRGTLVEAVEPLDRSGANVKRGDRGVVFEVTNAYGDGGGPMVRWFDGGMCNVYPYQVAIVTRPQVWKA
jgi:hypothetical protein